MGPATLGGSGLLGARPTLKDVGLAASVETGPTLEISGSRE